ncbi:uncharacterized protein B0H18DRAFT_1130158, partial [Fomitopsis serialis]|uniref:uncharacterized protein n=1 Tax=Fomitopsis serialis TaxID=139415 RepID=UPI002008C142
GFLHDLDHGFDWKEFLREEGYEDTLESWEQFIWTNKGILREDVSGLALVANAGQEPLSNSGNENMLDPARTVIISKGRKQRRAEKILAEEKTTTGKEYLVKWKDFEDEDNTWEPIETARQLAAMSDWLSRRRDQRAQLSIPYINARHAAEHGGEASRAVLVSDAGMSEGETRNRMYYNLKQRTGTFYFMAVEVLRGGVIHQARHDLESFFWLLVWLVFRHTRHNRSDPHALLRALFDGPSDFTCALMKIGFLGSSFAVHDNEPLSALLDEFSTLCEGNFHKRASKTAPSPLTYDAVLDIFDRALARTDWPENDAAIPFKPVEDTDTVPFHDAHYRSTWMSTGSQMISGAQHPVPFNMSPGSRIDAPVVARPLARGERGASGSRLLVRRPAWETFGDAEGAEHLPQTPRAASAGPAFAPWASPFVPPPNLTPEYPTPSSRRGSSRSVVLPMPPFREASGECGGSSSNRSEGEHQETAQGTTVSGSRRGRKRSREDLIASGDDLVPCSSLSPLR